MGFVKFKIIKRSTQVQAIAGFHDWKTLRKHWDVGVEMRCLSGEGIFLYKSNSREFYFLFVKAAI